MSREIPFLISSYGVYVESNLIPRPHPVCISLPKQFMLGLVLGLELFDTQLQTNITDINPTPKDSYLLQTFEGLIGCVCSFNYG